MFRFYSEHFPSFPLPPEYTFPRAFNYLNAESNSFYILERGEHEYIQCGGSKEACTVEVRLLDDIGSSSLFVVGHRDGSEQMVHIPMSDGGVSVYQREVLTHREAIRLFEAFFNGLPFSSDYSLRGRDSHANWSSGARNGSIS